MTDAGSSWPDDPLRALLGFHGRIRAALRSLDDFAAEAAEGRHDPLVARAVLDFFTGPLVWHDQDEERSLMPRLRRVRHPPRMERLLERISEAHEQMETRIHELVPHLGAIADDEEPPDAERLSDAAQQLRALLEPHLRMEEQEIIPLARLLLSEQDLEEMAAEMAQRLTERRAEAAVPIAPVAG